MLICNGSVNPKSINTALNYSHLNAGMIKLSTPFASTYGSYYLLIIVLEVPPTPALQLTGPFNIAKHIATGVHCIVGTVAHLTIKDKGTTPFISRVQGLLWKSSQCIAFQVTSCIRFFSGDLCSEAEKMRAMRP